MTKLKLVLCTMMVGAIVSPAVADITYTPAPLDGFEIGIFNPADSSLNSVYVDPAVYSDTFVFTFAIHVTPTYWPERLHFSFVYDNSSINVVHAEPVGDWAGSNYGSATWPQSSTGLTAVVSLSQWFDAGSTTYWYSSVNPFFKVTLHIKSASSSQENAFGIVVEPDFGADDGYGLMLESSFFTITPLQWDYYGGVIHEIPEPSSLLLLGAAAAGLFGYVRRRR